MPLIIRWQIFDQTLKVPIRIIASKVKETKVRTMVITTKRVNMSEIGTTNVIITSIGTTMVA